MIDSTRAPYGPAVLVALGWYATLTAAVVVGELQSAGDRSCEDASTLCFTPGQAVALSLVFATPFLLGLVVITLLLARPIARGVRSVPLAGTLTAAASVLVTALLGGLVMTVAR